MKTWLQMAAEGIVERFEQWDAEAMQQAQREKNVEAGMGHLEQCIFNYLSWMQANHSHPGMDHLRQWEEAETRDEMEQAYNEAMNEFNAVVAAERRER